jgi:N-formylglutamate deformylase
MLHCIQGWAPLVLDSPHSGTDYPADFGFSCELAQLRRAEDTHVEKLYSFAPMLGVSWVEALFPRSYLDVNRNVTEIDEALLAEPWPGAVATDAASVSKIRLGKGLVWRCTDDGTPIYARHLSVSEVRDRIGMCWKPYHAAVERAIRAAHVDHGYCVHINCHSMPSVASEFSTDFPGLAHADFVVGDREGTTADPLLSREICAFLRALGYTVDYNHPYKGVELVRRHGDPARARHSIQLEVNRRLYMDEQTLVMHGGFEALREDLKSLVQHVLAIDPRWLKQGALEFPVRVSPRAA